MALIFPFVFGFLAAVVGLVVLDGLAVRFSMGAFGLVVDGFWWGVLGALVLGLISWLVGLVVRPSRD